jgi:Flp pilus assembly pilin Flp
MSHLARERQARGCAGLYRSDDGAAAVEYAILSAMIAGAIVTAVVFFGSSLNETFLYVSSVVEGVAQSGPSNGGPANNGNGKGGNGKGNNGNGKGNGGSNGDA